MRTMKADPPALPDAKPKQQPGDIFTTPLVFFFFLTALDPTAKRSAQATCEATEDRNMGPNRGQ